VIVTRMALVLGIGLFGFLCWLATLGFTPAVALVVTTAVLFVLVAGGNALRGRSGSGGTRTEGRP
jgi:hypothetical protein